MKRILLLATTLAWTMPVAATVKSGVEAWQAGDPAGATAIWRRLADKGDADAAFNLGQAYRLGRGVPADSSQAQQWFERAARKDHLDAMVSLGILLFDSGNRAASMRWLRQAADRGEPRAMLMAGTALFNGDGVPRDPVKAYAYVSRAAAQGLAPAKATLEDMDKIIPLEQRKQGLALAQGAASKPAPSPRTVAAVKKTAKPTAKVSPPPTVATAAATATARGVWRVQLGAFSTKTAAEGLFGKLRTSAALAGRQPYFVAAGKVIRLQAGPFESRASASAACTSLKPHPCFAVEAR